MKINTGIQSGEFAAKALMRKKSTHLYRDEKGAWQEAGVKAWELSPGYYLSVEEVGAFFDPNVWEVKWPVEVFSDGLVYIPDESELKDVIEKNLEDK